MTDTDLKERILQAAVTLFCANGYHGTSMRNIAARAQCSLPMMYYYFKNKTELYEEIAVNQFFALTERLNAELDLSQSPLDLYIQFAMQRQQLNDNEKAVMKIAYKLWYGFEGLEELRGKIIHWELNRVENTRRIMDRHVADVEDRQVFAEVFTGFLENAVTKIVLMDEDISEEKLRRQLGYLLDKAK